MARAIHQPTPLLTSHDASIIDLLRELVEQVKLLRADLARPAMTLGRSDLAVLEQLIPAIAGCLGSEWFTSAELVESDQPALRLTVDGRNAKALGKLLARGTGHLISGYTVECAGTEKGVNLWSVREVIR